MKNRRNIINENLIYWFFFIAYLIFTITTIKSFFDRIMFISVGLFLGYELLLFGYKYYCKKKQIAFSHRIDFISAIIVTVIFVITILFHFSIGLFIYSLRKADGFSVEFDIKNLISPFLLIVFTGIYLAYLIKFNSKDKKNFYKIPYVFCAFCNTVLILVFVIILSIDSLTEFILFFIYLAVIIALVLVMIHFLIILLNLAFDGRFYGKKERIKVFLYNLFKKNLAYFIGIIFTLFMGIYFIIGSGFDVYYMYIGYIFLILSFIRIADSIWLIFISKKPKEKRYFHQYILIIVNAIVVLGSSLLIWNAFQRIVEVNNSGFTMFTVTIVLILIARIVFSVLGYYYSRINVKKEPVSIALNSLSIISVLISTYATVVNLILAFSNPNKTNTVIFVLSIVITSLIGVAILESILRGVLGIINTRKLVQE